MAVCAEPLIERLSTGLKVLPEGSVRKVVLKESEASRLTCKRPYLALKSVHGANIVI